MAISITLGTARCTTPIGDVLLWTQDDKLVALDFADNAERIARLLGRRFGQFDVDHAAAGSRGAACALADYFGGDLHAFDQQPIDSGGSEFQRRTWQALRDVRPGTTRSYSSLATGMGVPRAVRAVARANATNPIAIAIPCHRVIGVTGDLTGYAGGVGRKRWLLAHEGAC